ncbi:transposase [Streptomyces somaliensis]|uniref:transposase n=1 Tax=Streptomyces somaliensis TaxID=78355 RepID=UPI003703BDC1
MPPGGDRRRRRSRRPAPDPHKRNGRCRGGAGTRGRRDPSREPPRPRTRAPARLRTARRRAPDRHPAHRSKTARACLAEHENEVEPHFPPSSSPELNPDELVDADLERSLPDPHRAGDQAEPAAGTRRFFHRRQHRSHLVRGYSGGRHVRYVLDE